MHTQELEWDKDMVAQYGVDICVPEHARLEIPLYHAKEICARPGGMSIKQLPEFIQFQQETIRAEQAQEILHFSHEEQQVFGSHLVPRLYLERLTADPYRGLAETIHRIGKPYVEWSMGDYLLLTDMVESLGLDAGNCEVHRRPNVGPVIRACLIYDAKDTLRTVGLMDTKQQLSALDPVEFFGLAQSVEGIPLNTEALFIEHCIAVRKR